MAFKHILSHLQGQFEQKGGRFATKFWIAFLAFFLLLAHISTV